MYNVENYIEATLLSVQVQILKEFEVAIVNDGSTNNSLDIIDKFCDEDKCFKSDAKTSGGVAFARNMGIESCR